MSLSDESLLAGLASGDPEVSAAFVRRFQARVYGVALTIVGEAGMAEEVAQEAFIRAWRHAAAFDPTRGRVVTWVLAIARNAALDAARHRRQVPVDPVTLQGLWAGRADDPEERGLIAYDSTRVREAIALLPQEQRRAVLLSAFYGRTAREIGEMEGVPLGTAKTRIRSGLLKLRERLEVSDDR